jgi:transcriptional regulator with XRE-family HTH domain
MTMTSVAQTAAPVEQQQLMRDRFGARLLELMQLARLNHRTLAERAGLDRSIITRLINGERRANGDQVAKIAAALKVAPAELWKEAAATGLVSEPGRKSERPELRPRQEELDRGSSVQAGSAEGYTVKTDQARIVARLLDAIDDERERNAAMRACLDVLENPRALGVEKRPDRAQRGR